MIEIGAGIVMLGQSVIMTQPICQPYADIVRRLTTEYRETILSEVTGPDGNTLQRWGNEARGTYIVVLRKPDNVGCILEFGGVR